MVKNPPANAGDLKGMGSTSQGLGGGGSSGEENGNPLQYSCLQIPWTEDPGGLQFSVGSHRVGHDCSDLAPVQGIFWAQCLTFSKGTALSGWSRSL